MKKKYSLRVIRSNSLDKDTVCSLQEKVKKLEKIKEQFLVSEMEWRAEKRRLHYLIKQRDAELAMLSELLNQEIKKHSFCAQEVNLCV